MRDNEATMKCRICHWPKDLCECCIQHADFNNTLADYPPVTAAEREQPERKT